MAKNQNIVHEYFKRRLDDGTTLLVRLNPIHFTGTELSVSPEGQRNMRELTFDSEIYSDLETDGFESCNPLEFNLYLSGLAGL
jgi:hypothetical protein